MVTSSMPDMSAARAAEGQKWGEHGFPGIDWVRITGWMTVNAGPSIGSVGDDPEYCRKGVHSKLAASQQTDQLDTNYAVNMVRPRLRASI